MRPPQRVTVPLWLALLLRRQKRATVVPPDWLGVQELQRKLEQEQKEQAFSALPFRWLETSDLILDVASDDIPEADTVRRLLRDLREQRQAKARLGIEILDDRLLRMDNLGAMEINEIRPLFAGTMNSIRKLQEAQTLDQEAEGSVAAEDVENDSMSE